MSRQEWLLYCAKEVREKILGLLIFGDEDDYLGVEFRVPSSTSEQ